MKLILCNRCNFGNFVTLSCALFVIYIVGCGTMPDKKSVNVKYNFRTWKFVDESEWKQIKYDKKYQVEFISKDEEAAFEKTDANLILAIREVCARHIPTEQVTGNLFIIDEWDAQKTRYVDLSLGVLSGALIRELRSLLCGSYLDWRIRVVLFGDTMDGKSLIGGIMITSEAIFAERAVAKAMGK